MYHIVGRESWIYSDFNDGAMNLLPALGCHHGAIKGDGLRFPPFGKQPFRQIAGRRVLPPLVGFHGFGLWRHRVGRKGRKGRNERSGWDALCAPAPLTRERSVPPSTMPRSVFIRNRPSTQISCIPPLRIARRWMAVDRLIQPINGT